jgi:Spy/CpxP family protein refolding chaperone
MKKRIIFMFCAIFAAITICTAQNNADEKKAAFEAKRAEMVKKATERMKNDLSLSDEQAAKLEALNNEYLPKMRAGQPAMRRHKPGRPNSNHPKENFKGMKGDKCCNCSCQCCQESAKCDKAPKGDKAKKFDKAKKGDKKFKKPSKKQMKKHKEMMKKREEMIKKREEMMKKREEMMKKRGEEMRETRKAYNAKLNEILTPEQQEKLKSMRQERRGKKPANK